jgi:hypothetical protein
MKVKTIFWPTNINNKLGCHSMVHIDLAPKGEISEKMIRDTDIEIRVNDQSFPPTIWKLTSTLRLELHQLADLHTMPSHGVEAFDFCKEMITNHNLTTTSEVAVYYYTKK